MIVSKLGPRVVVLGCTFLGASSGAFATNSASKAQQACDALSGLHIAASVIGLPTSGAAVVKASLVAADANANGNGNAIADGNGNGNGNGEYCAVTGLISPVAPEAPPIEFQVNLPSTWNGKAVQMGGGGYDGTLVAATGRAALEPADVPTPLKQGFVTLGSDGGHKGGPGFDGRFGLNDEALLNYGKQSVKKAHDVAVAIIRKRYGRAAGKFYFIGGSQGGHEALDAAARYPADYDGVVSNFPAYNVTLLHLASLNVGKAIYGNHGAGWLSPAKTKLLTDAVYAACATVALDGVKDGIISNVAGCNAAFNIETVRHELACPAGQDRESCLTPAQIAAIEQITSPYRPGFPIAGMSEFPRWPLLEGALFQVSNFGTRPVPTNPPAQTDALLYNAGAATSKYIITRDPTLDALTFDPNTTAALRARTQQVAKIMDVTDVDLTAFRKKGGKIILVHGTADDFISPHNTIAYYTRQRELQGQKALDSYLRFYLIPGLGHGMGPFNAKYDGLGVLEEWVEEGHAPGTLTAVDENPATKGRARPMCVFPSWPKYGGTGSVDTASSYHCVER
jgi:pimeloyl-ACP methyl ester carboxylesterase